MRKIVFIASGWGAKHGGVNAFNYDLVCAVGEHCKDSVLPICIVEKATAEEINDAQKNGVILYQTGERFNAVSITKVLRDDNHEDISFWIGHDIITGNEAIECCNMYRDYLDVKGLSGVIHHMDYLSYYTSKTNDGNATLSKHKQQKKIFTTCDLVYAVGPFLKNSVENMLKEVEIEKEVIELIPGLANLKNVNISSPFKAISYGRLGNEDEIIKQGKLAVAAFSQMCKDEKINNSELTIIGLDNHKIKEKQTELFEIGYQYGEKLCTINGLPYIDRSEIYNLLKTQCASMMLSTHEGYGLAGWEAISAEVPLILSIDTGLYKFIDNLLGGAGTGCLFPVKITGNFEKDLSRVSEALSEIKQNLNRARMNAENLKVQLSKFSWQSTANQLISNSLINMKLEGLGSLQKVRQPPKITDEIQTSVPTDKSTTTAILTKPMVQQTVLKHDLYYSTSTLISNMIAGIYFNNLHYVWCAPSFNPAITNPISANPYEIYKNYSKEIQKNEMGPTIAKHKAGLINGASINRQKGIITMDQEQEIIEIIYAAEVQHFKPIIYVIPANKVIQNIKIVPQSKKAGIFSQEFLIEQLDGNMFHLIDLN